VLVTLASFLVSLLLIEIGERPDIGTFEGVIGGSLIGLGQSLVLWRRISQAWWWIFANIISWGLIGSSSLGAIGWVAPRTDQINLRLIYGIVDGLQIGVVLGIAQWLVFKKQISKAWRWILASSWCWSISLACGWFVGGVLRQLTRLFLGEVFGLTVTWLMVSMTTGAALISLLQYSKAPYWINRGRISSPDRAKKPTPNQR
ncbi:MAG: hypothetical protein F6J89_10220, partial [Symploca sp. SIO1C4]|nr:hypothetical protein [Symploca sp. SIO1C4]